MADKQSECETNDEYDVESLRVTREEASNVLTRQIEAMNEIKRKSAHVFRINLLLLGVVLTVASLLAGNTATPELHQVKNGLVLTGIGTSGISIVASLVVLTGPKYQTGLGSSDVRMALRQRQSEKKWLTTLLYSYAGWMRRNETTSQRDGTALYVAQFFLFFSVSYYAGGVIYGLHIGPGSWLPMGVLIPIYGIGTGILLMVSGTLARITTVSRFE